MFLLVYTPPSNIAQEILEIKTALFQKWGTPSAIALPPLIPLRIFEDEPKRNDIQQMYDITGHQFTTGEYIISNNSLFMEVDMGKDMPVSEPGFFPLFPGFHILSQETKAPPVKEIFRQIAASPRLQWTTGEFSLLSMILGTDQKAWWNYLRFEEVYTIKVRKGRKRKD